MQIFDHNKGRIVMADDYTVTAQRPTTIISKAGKVTPVIEVSFDTVPEGIPGKVDVPQAGYNVQTAKKAIEDQVSVLKGVHAL